MSKYYNIYVKGTSEKVYEGAGTIKCVISKYIDEKKSEIKGLKAKEKEN